MHLDQLIIDLAIILSVAGIMTIIFQKIKQPVVLGYILAGLIVGPHTPPVKLILDTPSIKTVAELGVIFLMFTLGLEFSFRKLLSVGVTAGLSAGLEVVFFLIVGFAIGYGLGWSSMDSLFLGAMLSISSTTIIIKALEELKLKSHKFAHLIFGILIVEDLFAILLLVGLTTIATSQGSFTIMSFLSAILNLAMVVGSWFITGYFLVPRLMSYLGRRGSNEVVTIISIALCLSLVVIASHFGYSPALGAFIMGSIIAETKIVHRIEGLMAPLKDLYGAIFFVSIGMLIDPLVIWEFKGTILLLSCVTVFGKIFITSLGALLSGQTIKNSLQVGMGLAQIGEFSFIIAGLGVALKVTSPNLYPIGVAVSLITTFTTPYFIKYSGRVADKMEQRIPYSVRRLINRYISWCEQKSSSHSKKREYSVLISRWIANGIIITFIFNLSLRNLTQLFDLEEPWPHAISWAIAFIVASPFIWGMVFTKKENFERLRQERDVKKAVMVFSFPILTATWISLLSMKYFSWETALEISLVFMGLIYLVLFKRLESSYHWFEETFLETFEKKEHKQQHQSVLSSLPWNSHVVEIPVHTNADFVGKTLAEAGIRQKFSVNVVSIQRGAQSIIAPDPKEVIYPHDSLVVLGADEQIDKLRPFLDVPKDISSRFTLSRNYVLKSLTLSEKSPLTGRKVGESGIRESYQAILVGIERNANRIMNPDVQTTFATHDVVWVVGENSKLDTLVKELS